MAWTRPELVDWVQARIDEVSENDQSAVIPQLIIERELDESALQVSRKCKKQLIYPAAKNRASQFCLVKKQLVPLTGTASGLKPYSVIIPLPVDFVRFLRIRLKEWNAPVDDLVSVDVNAYRHQYNKWQASTNGRPTAAIIPFYLEVTDDDVTDIYTQAIEVFPAPPLLDDYSGAAGTTYGKDETKVAAAVTALNNDLTPIYNSDRTKALISEFLIVQKTAAESMPDSLIDPIVWFAAARCFTNLRKPDLAQNANAQGQFALNQLLVGMKGEEVPAKGQQ